LSFERAVAGGAQNVTALPTVRPTTAVRQARIDETTGSSAASDGGVVFDEAIDIQLGFDRQSGHLAIVGGDVRIEPRLASQPAPGSLGAPEPGHPNPQSIGSIVNFVA
jgi:hypothetical protein